MDAKRELKKKQAVGGKREKKAKKKQGLIQLAKEKAQDQDQLEP